MGFELLWADVQEHMPVSAMIRHPYLSPECFVEKGTWKLLKSGIAIKLLATVGLVR